MTDDQLLELAETIASRWHKLVDDVPALIKAARDAKAELVQLDQAQIALRASIDREQDALTQARCSHEQHQAQMNADADLLKRTLHDEVRRAQDESADKIKSLHRAVADLERDYNQKIHDHNNELQAVLLRIDLAKQELAKLEKDHGHTLDILRKVGSL